MKCFPVLVYKTQCPRSESSSRLKVTCNYPYGPFGERSQGWRTQHGANHCGDGVR